jgi:hypothetical protein
LEPEVAGGERVDSEEEKVAVEEGVARRRSPGEAGTLAPSTPMAVEEEAKVGDFPEDKAR